ncbi:pyruvate decarboxylase [Streptomyces hygroscopicus subsp. jinggangensis 5008]|nr:pyruvate decarboxylase [Streptomyces hygroscopicus subsp. jinggangensis 5008]AGF61439.1 pyruvate decarboxylase [Streptomyces hygroscopicus subsp. jinggangensis TL01]
MSAARTARCRASSISSGPDTSSQYTQTSARWRTARPPMCRAAGSAPTRAGTGARSAAAAPPRRAGRHSSRGRR